MILDAKRGDIETTANAYASAAFDMYGGKLRCFYICGDVCLIFCISLPFNLSNIYIYLLEKVGSVTIAPYMGWDSVSPFVTGRFEGKGVFVLCKTSNPSSSDFQGQLVEDNRPLYEEVARKCANWNESLSSPAVGLVVGATDIFSLARVRKTCPTSWILCPGVGAQGGAAEEVCKVGLRYDGSGILVSVSRGISAAADIQDAATVLRDKINICRERHFIASVSEDTRAQTEQLKDFQRDFISFAVENKVLQFGSFVLKSGRTSPYFFNAGLFCSGKAMQALGQFYAQALKDAAVDFDLIFGPAYKGIPLATAISIAWFDLYGDDKDIAYNRKEAKDHGEGGQLVGAPMRDRKVVIVDDVISAGTAIRESLDILTAAGAIVSGIIVSLDRQEVRSEEIRVSAIQAVQKETGVPVVSIVRLGHLVSFLEKEGGTTHELMDEIRKYRAEYGVDY